MPVLNPRRYFQLVETLLLMSSQDLWTPSGPNHFAKVPNDPLVLIFELLSYVDLVHLAKTCKQFRHVINQYFLLEKRDLVCFHSKLTADATILGICVNIADNIMSSSGRHFKKMQ